MKAIPYDERFDPPAPVVPLRLRVPAPAGWVQFTGLVDTGADITVIPSDVAERYLPVGGSIRIRGVTGFAEEAVLYRAEVAIGNSRHLLLLVGLGSEVIVGRDLLNQFDVKLDGPNHMLEVGATLS